MVLESGTSISTALSVFGAAAANFSAKFPTVCTEVLCTALPEPTSLLGTISTAAVSTVADLGPAVLTIIGAAFGSVFAVTVDATCCSEPRLRSPAVIPSLSFSVLTFSPNSRSPPLTKLAIPASAAGLAC